VLSWELEAGGVRFLGSSIVCRVGVCYCLGGFDIVDSLITVVF
jgi:hypothetical protein